MSVHINMNDLYRRFCNINDLPYNLRGSLHGLAIMDRDVVWDNGVVTTSCEAIAILLDHGYEVNEPNEDGETPLYTACENGSTEVVKLFLAHDGVEVN